MSNSLKADILRTLEGAKQPALKVVPFRNTPEAAAQFAPTPHWGALPWEVLADESDHARSDLDDMLVELDTLVQAQTIDRASAPPLLGAQVVYSGLGAVQTPQQATSRVASIQSPAQGIALVNANYFVAPLADETTVWRESVDYETGRRTTTPVSTESLRLAFAPFTVDVPTPSGTRSLALADVWLRSKQRREYPGGVILQPEGPTPPGCFNLWQGFGVKPTVGNATPMVAHILMLCGGVTELAEYVLNWFAFCVQRPGSRPEVAMVLRGGRGTGKGTVFRILLMIFGRNGRKRGLKALLTPADA